MIQVKNNKITQYFLPDELKDKSKEELRKDGWFPVVEKKPIYDKEKEILLETTYEILEDKAILHYGKIPNPNYVEPESDKEPTEAQQILYETQYQTMLLEMGGGV